MLWIKKGNILDSKEQVILHQVNVFGAIGGLAEQLAKKYEKEYDMYKKFCFDNNCDYDILKGKYLQTGRVVHCFTQDPNWKTDYISLDVCLNDFFKENSDVTVIAIPYKYGCGIASGCWEKVESIFLYISNKYNKDVVVYKLED